MAAISDPLVVFKKTTSNDAITGKESQTISYGGMAEKIKGRYFG